MYSWCGRLVSRWPLGTVLAWVAILILVIKTAPPLSDVAKDGEFAFLPAQSESVAAEQKYKDAFPPAVDEDESADDESGADQQAQLDPLGANIVIVLQRKDRPAGEGLSDADLDFVRNHLVPYLRKIKARTGLSDAEVPLAEATEPLPKSQQIISGIWTFEDVRIGKLLESKNGKSTLVIVDLTTEFLNRKNKQVLFRVEELLKSEEVIRAMPAGLDVALSGSATVGRDMLKAESESAAKTDHYTKVLVIVLLLLIYRAPLMVLIPLITVGVAVRIALNLLRILADYNIVGLFTGLDVYVTVVVYGAGVDFCLFLIARYKEELDHGASYRDATMRAVAQVGAALATSAGTSIVGIAMLTLTEFGKFQQAGVAISFGLGVALVCAMTLTPALMFLFGRWTFWPDVRRERISAADGFMPSRTFWQMLEEQRWLERGWEWIAELISRRPGAVFFGTVLALTPLALVGAYFKDHLSYGLLTDLRPDVTSVKGANAVKQDFPSGTAGPTVFLIEHPNFDLTEVRFGEKISRFLTEDLMSQAKELGIADVRSQYYPYGALYEADSSSRPVMSKHIARTVRQKHYCSVDERSKLRGQLMRIDVVFDVDPFARDAVARLDQAQAALKASLKKFSQPAPEEDEEEAAPPPQDYSDAKVLALGSTASIRDLKLSTDRDQIRINVFVSIAVFLVLMLLLRQPLLCAYLILTVIFSYLVTLGAAYLLFWFLSADAEFVGLDWKVPVYLFTLLLALGEDYNVLFMSRVTEEQPKHGAIPGILLALTKTGGIISSCGIIMAGTFASLMTGTLAGMVQLGFALAFGVLIDTFIVRPILVPSYLVLLNNGTFGRLSKLLGAYQPKADETPIAVK